MTTGYDHKRETLAPGASLVLAMPTMDGSLLRYFAKIGKQLEVVSGVAEVQTLQFVSQALMNDGDSLIIYDEVGQGWGFWTQKTGGAVEPNYAAWLLLDADHKVEADIQGDVTADQVAQEFKDARTTFGAPFNDKFSAGIVSLGAWNATALYPANGYTKNLAAATSTGAITTSNVFQGTDGGVDITNDRLKSIGHGLTLNDAVQVTTNGTLPTGIVAATDYYANPLNADEFELLDSPSGSVIDISDIGNGTQTLGSVGVNVALKVEGSMLPQGSSAPLFYPASTQNITNPGYNYQGLTSWEFVQAKITLTNNGLSATYVDIGATCKS